MGAYLYAIIRGQDDRPVVAERACKSISAENTFAIDLGDGAELQAELRQICADLATRLEKHGLFGKTLTLKVKFHDFQQITRSITRLQDFESEAEIFAAAHDKLRAVCAEEFPEKPIRLLGVGISNFAREDNADRSRTPQQLELFPTRYF
jgi:DNA polymerase IV